jgi:membrane protein YqaA with SNARE-associated domain
MWPYLAAFFCALLVDCIPVFAPPAWPILIFFVVKFELNPWLVILLGVIGTTIGRFVLSTYIPWVANKVLDPKEDENLKFLGEKLSQTRWKTLVFVLLYSLTPLSTTALFTAAGIANVKKLNILPPFFIGKLISYSVLIWLGDYAANNGHGLLSGTFSVKGIISAVLGLLIIAAFLFIDWKTLLQKKKLKLNFKIWNS